MKKAYRLFLAFLLFFPTAFLTAQDTLRTWTGAADSDFTNTQNWNPAGRPENTHVIIPQNPVFPILDTLLFAPVRSVNILSGGRLLISLLGRLNTSDSLRIDSSGFFMVNSTNLNPLNVGGNSVIGGVMDIPPFVGGTMTFNGRVVVLNTGLVHIGGAVQISNIQDDVVLNGRLDIDPGVAAFVWCRGDWRRGAGSVFNSGASTFYFTNPTESIDIDRGTFHSLVLGPAQGLRIEGNVGINNALLLRDTVAISRGDTLTINNRAAVAISDSFGGRITRGVVRRLIDTTVTGTLFRFHDNNIALRFDTLAIPRSIIMNAEPDTVLGPSGNYYVRRFYEIEREGGSGFRARLYLRYLQSEVRSGADESQFRLWRTTNNGQTWIFVGGSVDTVNNVITADSVREFSKWGVGIPTSPPSAVNQNTWLLPTEVSLAQNFPNPFNPTTRIQYTIRSRTFVTLRVFNLLGAAIATLVNKEHQPGTFEFEWTAEKVPSGVYFYRIQAGSFVQTRKMVLLR